MIPVSLVTGFLGSGKTTLLKQIVAQNRIRKFVYLVNEFSPNDVDGALIADKTADTVVIPGGSIFCRCLVTQFVTQMKQIPQRFAAEGRPIEGVVIEASGIADPKVIHKMLAETRLDEVYDLRNVIAVVDPLSFHKLLQTLPNIRAQIEAADTIIINKSDKVLSEELSRTEDAVRALNVGARIVKTSFCRTDLDIFKPVEKPVETAGEFAPCADPHYTKLLIRNKNVSLEKLKQAVAPVADDIFRLKGFIEERDELYYVDYSASGWQTEKAPASVHNAGLSVIINGENRQKIVEHFREIGLLG